MTDINTVKYGSCKISSKGNQHALRSVCCDGKINKYWILYTHLTWRRRSVEVNLFAVLSEPGLVATPHSENVHAVHLHSVYHRACPLHFIQSQPWRRRVWGADAAPRGTSSSLVLDREVPRRG